ncbi:MAG: phospholipid carrier-dependent glycosyltransferase [Comamonadaceae bacterium]|nr:MAG: phospholipid carrier-dependent glycosyltransferase [Comamonadaceae bacterium]
MTNPEIPRPVTTLRRSNHLVWLGLALLIALLYLYGLGGDHIPRNGDELVYANIARLTAESGHWLPLVSSWDFMRNTKPPVLFWQAIVAGGWGDHWTLFNLRLPSLFYTWAIALMTGLLAAKIVRDGDSPGHEGITTPPASTPRKHAAIATGAIAAIMYLSFFTTYRYGRPFMTSAPETFWLFGIFFVLAWAPRKLLASNWKFPLAAGLMLGLGCLYKSFAMVVPAGVGLALCYQMVGAQKAPWKIVRRGIAFDAVKVLVTCLLGLGLFGLWFAVDPDPASVWREFVVGENAGKFKSSPGYFKVAFSGGSGFLTILTGYFSNAIFLLPVTVGCAIAAFKNWRLNKNGKAGGQPVGAAEKILWIWMLALMLVFLLPNQRSTRYLIPAMPALAILVALYWHRIARLWFILTLVICIGGALAMGLIAYGGIGATGLASLFSPLYWLFLGLMVVAGIAGIARKQWTRPVTSMAAFSVILALAWVTSPFNGELARFKPASLALMQGQTVAVPSNFNGHFERYAFIIPGAKVKDYYAEQPVDYADVETLLKNNRYVLVQRRPGQLPCAPALCRIVDERWDLRSRQNEKGGAMAAIRHPETFWYAKEYLVEKPTP